MAKDYDPSKGIVGFQEYQGSPREENIDGEPRVFRTYYGPAENRGEFLRTMFGAAAIKPPDNDCVVICSPPVRYPMDSWLCEESLDDSFLATPKYAMEPVSYRTQPWDDSRSQNTTADEQTQLTTLGQPQPLVRPDVECGVLIEVEYRRTLLEWPEHVHDPSYTSTMNAAVDVLYGPDVPFLLAPTSVDLRHEIVVEAKTIKGRNMEICSYGTTVWPSLAAGKAINQITSDDIEPVALVNLHTFVVTLRNVPFLGTDFLAGFSPYIGAVNNDVWFGYPAHAVSLTEINPTPRYHPSNQIYYDVEYTFLARYVLSNGELPGMVMPAASLTNGSFIYNGMVGIWNRAWWEFPITGTRQHWWPITEKGQSSASAVEPYADRKLLLQEGNFHALFSWWQTLCPEPE